MDESTVITRVVLHNYRSIASCDVRLRPLVFLVGPNGSGKSNFIDALRFVSDALRKSLDDALRERGGIGQVRRRAIRGPRSFRIELEIQLGTDHTATYSLQILPLRRGLYRVQEERLVITSDTSGVVIDDLHVRNGKLVRFHLTSAPGSQQEGPIAVGTQVVTDTLFLPIASIISPLVNQVSRCLSSMSFYKLVPEHMRTPKDVLLGYQLFPDGGNVASVLRTMERKNPANRDIIVEYLRIITPGLTGVRSTSFAGMDTIEFLQDGPDGDTLTFQMNSVSDGTIRALGILVALFQYPRTPHWEPHVVAIEEPELALHPAAVGILLDALQVASHETQVLVTSHSPDLLDDDQIDPDSILAVEMDHATTRIGPIDDVGRGALRDRLFTSGELLRHNQLFPQTAPNGVVRDDAVLVR